MVVPLGRASRTDRVRAHGQAAVACPERWPRAVSRADEGEERSSRPAARGAAHARPGKVISQPHPASTALTIAVPAASPRLIATDLDGTLLRPDGSLSVRTRRALAGLAAVGIELVLVTARPPRWVDHLADVVGAHGTVICANGAFVYDVPRRAIAQAYGISASSARAIAADLRRLLPGVGFAAELADGVHIEREYPELHPDAVPAGASYGDIDALDRPVGKLLARSLHMPEAEFVARVADIVGARAEVTYSGVGGLAEIGPSGVTKASSLIEWCTARGITKSSVWAFGDMPNDLPMLTWAAVSFAVANAHPDVLAAASHSCPSNADDGVATVMESLLTGLSGHARRATHSE
jgi:Cof subfamily protein (haloacid dehalogenase superfamily)